MHMMSPEQFIAEAPEEKVKELLTGSLTYVAGGDTLKYVVDGHPGLYVRQYEKGRQEARELHEAHEAMAAMSQYNLAILPARVHTSSLGNYVVTVEVQGEPLDRRLQAPHSPEYLTQLDRHYKHIGEWLVGEAAADRSTVMDVYGTNQYMDGLAGSNPEPAFWLVDIPHAAVGDDSYMANVYSLAHGLLEAEHTTRAKLPLGRAALIQAVAFAPEIARGTAEPTDIIHHALETNTQLSFDYML